MSGAAALHHSKWRLTIRSESTYVNEPLYRVHIPGAPVTVVTRRDHLVTETIVIVAFKLEVGE